LAAWTDDVEVVHPSQHFLHFEEIVECGFFEVKDILTLYLVFVVCLFFRFSPSSMQCLAKVLTKAQNKKWNDSLRDQEHHIVHLVLGLIGTHSVPSLRC
jgi:hypothetical protein